MSKEERNTLESFARCLGVSIESRKTLEGYVVFPGQENNHRYRGFDEYRDAMLYIVLSPSTDQGWRESGKLN